MQGVDYECPSCKYIQYTVFHSLFPLRGYVTIGSRALPERKGMEEDTTWPGLIGHLFSHALELMFIHTSYQELGIFSFYGRSKELNPPHITL